MELIGCFFVCLWIADFLSGLFHWLEDTYCRSGMPVIGHLVCDPNLLHHADPKAMLKSGFVQRNYIQWIACVAVGLIAGVLGVLTPCFALVLFLLSWSNEIHAWNHKSKNNRFVAFVKSTGLVQSQKQHSIHHRPPFDRNYCVLTSLVNPILETVGFWRRLEWFIFVMSGLRPRRNALG